MIKIERPQAEKRKIHSSNEFELCYIRHQYFRRVEYNPTKAEMDPYTKIVWKFAYKSFYTYSQIFDVVGMTSEDVKAIGMIHLVNFLGLFEFGPNKNQQKYDEFCAIYRQRSQNLLPSPEALLSKNKANFTIFIKQRMEDVVRVCRQKAKNIKGFKVDSWLTFYGPNQPPEDFSKILGDHEAYGFKKLDYASFRTARKKAKSKGLRPFKWAGYWYVALTLKPRSLTMLDLEVAGWNQQHNEFGSDPETVLTFREEEIRFDKQVEMFKNRPREDRQKIILEFIEKNSENPKLQEEVVIARKYLREMTDVG